MNVTRNIDFDVWYRREYSRVLAAVHVAQAADATDEAFVRALERWDDVLRMTSPTGWVIRVAANITKRSRWRSGKSRQLLTTHARAEGEFDHYPDLDLWKELGALTSRQRLALALRYVEDLPQSVVAEVLGVAPGTAAATLHQARSQLRSNISNTEEGQP